ncbi:hypothetical protein KKJ22_18445 [Xenorhabdus bovienii]|uniref:hypothetical protein n=1 Tax=Xenorhabdus bovienii TaxID=40576 RepID=UPI0023B280B1|nr:hypothetical protein [Xenorhabdus bovienii]MDE9499739.1 hypothetical protein [Xenorhabdus bovienii]
MLTLIYKYKVNSFFGETILPLNSQLLCYYADDEEFKNDKELCFKDEFDRGYIQTSSWDFLFREYVPTEYWNEMTEGFFKSEEIKIKEIKDIDYYNVSLIANRMFSIFDINMELCSYRKELTKFYCHYQIVNYNGNDDIRLSFLKRLLGEMWIWDLAYNKLSINNNELIYTAENGGSYNVHNLIDHLCNMIHSFSLPDHLLNILLRINKMMHECIDLLLGKNVKYDFGFYDINAKYIDANCFLDIYKNNNEMIFNVLKDCTRDSQSFRELFISHMIIKSYSFFVLKDNPDEILLFKSFLVNNEEIFIKLLSLVIDINFYVSEDDFDGLDIEIYLEKIEKSNFLLDR